MDSLKYFLYTALNASLYNSAQSHHLILPEALGPGVYSASNRNEYQKYKNNNVSSKVRRLRMADNLTAICEQIV
jgi:hypothetical protein